MIRFSDIHPSKKVTQCEISFLTIYITLGFDVIFMIFNTYYSNWVHFQKLVQAKMLISITFLFQWYITLYVLEQKTILQKDADISSHLTLETCLPWKILSVVYTDHVCKVLYFCQDLHNAMPNTNHKLLIFIREKFFVYFLLLYFLKRKHLLYTQK